MIKKTFRNYMMLSITVFLTFTFLLGFLIYTDSGIYNKYKELMGNDYKIILSHNSMALDSGSYNIVILAHSYSSNPALTKPKKITFGHDLTDTFLWTEECNLDENQTKTVNMHRVVGMFRLTTTDTIPSNVASVRFYYTGGSSSLDASTGLGCVESRQTSSFTITDDMKRQTATFDAYTFPKAEEGSSLTINVTALDKNDNVVAEKQFVDIPVMRNQITSYRGKLFSGGDVSGGGNVTIHLTTDDEWTVVEHDF